MNNKISWTFSGPDTENWILNTFNYIILFSPTVLKTLRSFQSLRNDNFLFFFYIFFWHRYLIHARTKVYIYYPLIWCTRLQKYIFITHLFDARAYKSMDFWPSYLMHEHIKVFNFYQDIWCTRYKSMYLWPTLQTIKYVFLAQLFGARAY